MPRTRLMSDLGEDDRAVGAAKAKGIGERHIDLGITRNVGDVIQIATFVRLGQIDRRRHRLMRNGQGREDGFDTACRTQQMSGHRFG